MPAGSKVRLVMQDLYLDLLKDKITSKYTEEDIKKAI